MMKSCVRAILVFVFAGLLAACGGGDAAVGPVEPVFVEEPVIESPVEEDNGPPEGWAPGRWDSAFQEAEIPVLPLSLLTGLPVEEYGRYRRPLAVVVNNIHRALPQSGIASADIVYEVLSEGDVTRLVAIFQSYVPDMIGPVRSARDYFVDFAFNHDAIFIHHGASPSGAARIRNLNITGMDGMALEGTVFWRDRTYPYWHRNTGTRPLEHSSHTGWSRIYNHMYSRGLRGQIGDNPAFGFAFGNPLGMPGWNPAERIVVPFSANYTRTFVFDADSGLYMVENRDGEHRDATTREQVAVANVLVQLTSKQVIAGDAEGRRVVGTVGEGDGFFATMGQYLPVRWVKDSHTEPMRWYFEDGRRLVLSPGRTWINVFQSTGTVRFEGDSNEEE